MILYINDFKIDLPDGFKFARSKQVNTIGRLDNVQTNYSQLIKLEKTKNNILAANNLGSIGNNSPAPYIINTANLYGDNGVSEIFNGYAVFKKTTDFFEVVIYDGYISFTKAIENKSLKDADVSELDHLINIDTVIESWTLDLPYKYIVADYNGKTTLNGKLNVDYLIPSVNVKYLWDKVHEFAGFTYSGSVFLTEEFKNLWITYPKTIGNGTEQFEDVADTVWSGPVTYFSTEPNDLTPTVSSTITGSLGDTLIDNQYLTGSQFITGGFPIGSPNTFLNNTWFNINQTGRFRVRISGTIVKPTFVNLPFDGSNINLISDVAGSTSGPTETVDAGSFTFGVPFDFVAYINVDAGQRLFLGCPDYGAISLTGGTINVNIDYITGNAVDFQEALIELGMKTFIDEILWRHSLTPFVDPVNKNVNYLTHQEWLQTADVEDWSSENNKFSRRLSETYELGKYAKRNYLRYKYNDSNSDHNDGYLIINNDNLPAQKTVIQSKFFSPEKTLSIVNSLRVYKFWEKNNKDDGSVDYRELNNRFYIMRSVDNQTPLNLVSEVSGLEDRYEGTHPQEDFSRLEFNEIIDLYYQPIYGLLNTARLVNNEIYLNDLDIQNLRFDKLYYIKEESSYFILNKIPNYIEEGLYNVSMLEVDYYSEEPNEPSLQPYITLQSSYLPANTPFTFNDSIVNNYAFVNYVSDGANLRARRITEPDPSGTYTGFEFNEVVNLSSTQLNLIFPIVIPAAQLGWYEIQITDINTLQSNIQYVFVGSDDTPQASIAVNLVDTGNVELPYPQRIRDIFFRFNNFTPLFCTFELQAYVSIGFPAVEGEIYNYTVPAAQLNEGVDNYLSTGVLDFATQWQYWRIIITTDLGTETRAAFMP